MRFPKGSGKVLDWKDWIPYPYKGYTFEIAHYREEFCTECGEHAEPMKEEEEE